MFAIRICSADSLVRGLASLMLCAGTAGMGVSFLYLASANYLDVFAGGAGFVAGSILAATGLLSITIASHSILAQDRQSLSITGSWALSAPLVRRWMLHFQRNRENRPEPAWDAPISLPADAVRPLVRSLEEFQLGDGGGPAALIAWDAEQFRSSSEGTRNLVDLWFAEEREHARLLAAAVSRFGGRCIHGHWSFTIFLQMRRLLGVQFEMTVLLLTEIVSTVYYRLLRRHGDDEAIRSMCRLILRDESGHIAFHRGRLAECGQRGHHQYGNLWELRFRALGLAAATMLWINHAPGLVALGASRSEFYREVWRELSRFINRLRRDVSVDSVSNGLATSDSYLSK